VTDRRFEDVPVGRYAVLALLAIGVLLAITLAVRPFIFGVAGPLRDDDNYTLTSVSEADQGPRLIEVVLNDSHGLAGEVERDDRVGYSVVLAPLPGRSGYSVVGAWSPTADCALTIDQDRLRDCRGDTWTFDGFPFDSGDPALTAFPAIVRNGAVIADFTSPIDPAAS
jgi:hypothetical protein